jgi:hypothetical protein
MESKLMAIAAAGMPGCIISSFTSRQAHADSSKDVEVTPLHCL